MAGHELKASEKVILKNTGNDVIVKKSTDKADEISLKAKPEKDFSFVRSERSEIEEAEKPTRRRKPKLELDYPDNDSGSSVNEDIISDTHSEVVNDTKDEKVINEVAAPVDETVVKPDKTRNNLQQHSSFAEKFKDKRSGNSLRDSKDIPDKKAEKKPKPRRSDADKQPVTTDTVIPMEKSNVSKSEQSENVTNRTIQRLEKKSEKIQRKIKLAEEKLPTHRVFHVRREVGKKKLRYKRKIRLEKEAKPVNKRDGIVKRGLKETKSTVKNAVSNNVHGEISKYEDENQTLKAAHLTEKAAESALHFSKETLKTANRKLKEKPYKKVSKLKMKSERVESKLSYQRSVAANTAKSETQKSALQKNAVKKAQQKRNQKKNAKKAKETAKKASEKVEEVIVKTVKTIASSRATIIVVVMFLIFFGTIQIFGGSFLSSLSNSGSAIIATTYTSTDEDIYAAEGYMQTCENQLLDYAQNISKYYVGWNEYNISVCEMKHDPYKLISYLSAMRMNFKYDDGTTNMISEIVDGLYSLDVESIHEVRSETHTETDDEGNEIEVTVYYDYYILNVNLTENDWDDVVNPKLETAGTKTQYDLLNLYKGNKPYLFE